MDKINEELEELRYFRKWAIGVFNNPIHKTCRETGLQLCYLCGRVECCDNDNPLVAEIRKLRKKVASQENKDIKKLNIELAKIIDNYLPSGEVGTPREALRANLTTEILYLFQRMDEAQEKKEKTTRAPGSVYTQTECGK